ncbi:hypothetical protein H2200_006701 [Cladophialophora chaetospira]|uniref:Nudix hydrolase domain-containing protein n=1 Tax=Cladophialophora chaetospira TaxID=386627 RepID=A0AA38X8W3_9EURO|nr:hypothetical protein H2200_006701 [Cladophialophora chaetospira]
MPASDMGTEHFSAEAFVESAGAILFRVSAGQICILHHLAHDHYVLPKGRRHCGEGRHEAAIRELAEETGHQCRLLPVNMTTRAPPASSGASEPDEVRPATNICEPFYLQIRHPRESEVKVIWWYIAVEVSSRDQRLVKQSEKDKERFTNEFHDYGRALDKLSFDSDRGVVKQAVAIVEETFRATAGEATEQDPKVVNVMRERPV